LSCYSTEKSDRVGSITDNKDPEIKREAKAGAVFQEKCRSPVPAQKVTDQRKETPAKVTADRAYRNAMKNSDKQDTRMSTTSHYGASSSSF
jgi:hypothetical protein